MTSIICLSQEKGEPRSDQKNWRQNYDFHFARFLLGAINCFFLISSTFSTSSDRRTVKLAFLSFEVSHLPSFTLRLLFYGL